MEGSKVWNIALHGKLYDMLQYVFYMLHVRSICQEARGM